MAPSTFDLQWKLIYAMIVAGKTARFANDKVDRLRAILGYELPFDTLAEMTDAALDALVRRVGTGNYTKLAQGLRALAGAGLDLATCGPGELQAIHGIGPKTARFFILWTRPGARYAALDVHVLRWLRARGHKAPTTTPQAESAYRRLEEIFLAEADKRNLTPRELDLRIWEASSTAPNLVRANHDDQRHEGMEHVERERAARL